MRVLIDEDTAVQLIDVLRQVLVGHEVDHVIAIGWSGKKDRSVLRDAKQAGYGAFITKDRNQLSDPDECDAIKSSGLHHIRYKQRHEGAYGLALALAAIIAAMPLIVQDLEAASGQRLVRITGLDPYPVRTRRYEVNDPQRNPPSPYWR